LVKTYETLQMYGELANLGDKLFMLEGYVGISFAYHLLRELDFCHPSLSNVQ